MIHIECPFVLPVILEKNYQKQMELASEALPIHVRTVHE
jgi:hypothetical protein